jgi:hypothetical protein
MAIRFIMSFSSFTLTHSTFPRLYCFTNYFRVLWLCLYRTFPDVSPLLHLFAQYSLFLYKKQRVMKFYLIAETFTLSVQGIETLSSLNCNNFLNPLLNLLVQKIQHFHPIEFSVRFASSIPYIHICNCQIKFWMSFLIISFHERTKPTFQQYNSVNYLIRQFTSVLNNLPAFDLSLEIKASESKAAFERSAKMLIQKAIIFQLCCTKKSSTNYFAGGVN